MIIIIIKGAIFRGPSTKVNYIMCSAGGVCSGMESSNLNNVHSVNQTEEFILQFT